MEKYHFKKRPSAPYCGAVPAVATLRSIELREMGPLKAHWRSCGGSLDDFQNL